MPSTGPSTLFLPLRERASVWAATLALFLSYALNAARDLSLYDSGELAIAAVQLGLGHPPGQPLHTLFGFALTKLPFVSPLFGVTLASVIPGALVLVPACAVTQCLAGDDAPPWVARVMPWLLALCAQHPVLWEPATRVEVYSLATFFAIWAVARVTFPANAESNAAEPDAASLRTLAPKHVFAAGLALGACASVNPMIALCTGLALAPCLLARIVRKQLALRAIAFAVAGGVLGLLPYAYVFAVASRTDVMIWGAPNNAQSALRYFLLRDYDPNHALTLTLWTSHFFAWFPWAFAAWLLPVLALGLAGHVELGTRSTLGRSVGPLLLALLVAQISFNVVWNLEVPDYAGYVASAIWLLFAAAAAFIAHALTTTGRGAAAIMAACLALSSLGAVPNVLSRTRAHDRLARTLAERVLAEAPPHAIVIAEVDYLAGALFYLQEVEHARPDVAVLAYGLGSSSWHWQRLYRTHPDLAPFSLVGPGGKPARVQRWLAANFSRPVLLERLSLARELGLRACRGGLYFRTGEACQTPPDTRVAGELARQLTQLRDGSPGADGALAQVTFQLGMAFWNLGDARAAYGMLLAGVLPSLVPAELRTPPEALRTVGAFTLELPPFQRAAALGDPARNLFVMAQLLDAAGLQKDARAVMHSAVTLGLPEAIEAENATVRE